MWAETEEPGDLYPRRQGGGRGRRDLMRPPSLYPQRVPPHLIVEQQRPQSQPVGRGSPASRLLAERSRSRSRSLSQSPAAPSDDSVEDSSSELGAGGKEVSTLQLFIVIVVSDIATVVLAGVCEYSTGSNATKKLNFV
jgi:hypothetical protein